MKKNNKLVINLNPNNKGNAKKTTKLSPYKAPHTTTTWFRRLINKEEEIGLLSTNVEGKFIVCDHRKDLFFRAFKSPLEFYHFMYKPSHPALRCYYEIVLGENSQKPHFDIDLPKDEIRSETVFAEILSDIITVIVNVMKEADIHINLSKDIILCVGNDQKKFSAHIIIDNYCHENNQQAKNFYDCVVQQYRGTKCLDEAVYNPKQQFRILGCKKFGTTRIKTFCKIWNYQGNQIKYIHSDDEIKIYHASLVTDTGNCIMLPSFGMEKVKEYYSSVDLSQDDVEAVYKKCIESGKGFFPFDISEVQGAMIILKRTAESKCLLCKGRIHQNNNAYLTVLGENKTVRFYCHRTKHWNPNGPQFKVIGDLEDNDATVRELFVQNICDDLLNSTVSNSEDDEIKNNNDGNISNDRLNESPNASGYESEEVEIKSKVDRDKVLKSIDSLAFF